MNLELLPNSTTITDLDDDGITETTFIYKKICKGDVSPSYMNVLLIAGKDFYCIRGQMYSEYAIGPIDKSIFEFDLSKVDTKNIKKSTADYYDIRIGRYENENDFKRAPVEFLFYVKSRWKEYFDKDDVSYSKMKIIKY